MSRLVVISNRVQSVDAPSGNQGGLAVALLAALREKGGVWFGWSGSTTETFTGHINFQQGKGVTTATIDLEEQDFDEYYNGYANRTLWPLFHYRIDLTEFERDHIQTNDLLFSLTNTRVMYREAPSELCYPPY